jgi:pimeloyl-ACP methyl ester carboxylesterase
MIENSGNNLPVFDSYLEGVMKSKSCFILGVMAVSSALALSLAGTAEAANVNNMNCKATPERNPVILLPAVLGTVPGRTAWEFNYYPGFLYFFPALTSVPGLAHYLSIAGYCVYGFDYGKSSDYSVSSGTGTVGQADLITAASEIAEFVKSVAKAANASQVTLIGHSMGGVQARYVANVLLSNASNGKPMVDKVIMLEAPNHPLPVAIQGYSTLAAWNSATSAQFKTPGLYQIYDPTSQFWKNLNGTNPTVPSSFETKPGISYYNLATTVSWADSFGNVVFRPNLGWGIPSLSNNFVTQTNGATVVNDIVQTTCPNAFPRWYTHYYMVYRAFTAQWVLHQLNSANPPPSSCAY